MEILAFLVGRVIVLIMLSFILGVVVGVVASYLVFRNNPKYKAKVDVVVDKVEAKLDKK